jgi:hypothetical protein
MNERIRLLAEQAGLPKYITREIGPTVIQKFTELIVQECVEIAGKYGTPDGYYISAEINRIMLNIRTDKGFGVE